MGTLWELKTLQSLKVRGSRWQEQAPVILSPAPTNLVVSQGLIFFATNRSTSTPYTHPQILSIDFYVLSDFWESHQG